MRYDQFLVTTLRWKTVYFYKWFMALRRPTILFLISIMKCSIYSHILSNLIFLTIVLRTFYGHFCTPVALAHTRTNYSRMGTTSTSVSAFFSRTFRVVVAILWTLRVYVAQIASKFAKWIFYMFFVLKYLCIFIRGASFGVYAASHQCDHY